MIGPKMLKFFLVVFLFFSVVWAAFPASGIVLNDSIESVDLSDSLLYYEDQSGLLNFAEISDTAFSSRFVKAPSGRISYGTSKSVFWFRFSVLNLSTWANWLVQVDYPVLNQVSFYFTDSSGKLDRVVHQGLDFSSGTARNQHQVFFVHDFNPKQIQQVFVRVHTSSYLFFPLKLQKVTAFVGDLNFKHTLYLTFYGLSLGMVLLNLILLVLTREKSYFWLFVFLATLVVNSYYQYGMGFRLLGSNGIFGASQARTMIFYITIIAYALFTVNYLDLHRYRRLYLVFRILIAFFVLFLPFLLVFKLPMEKVNQLTPVVYLTGALICMATAIYTASKGHRTSLYYLVSFCMFIISSVIWLLLLKGSLKFTSLVYYVNVFSGSLFSLLLTVGLMEKITAIRRERARSDELAAVNLDLQREISERKLLQQTLSSSEEKFRLLFKNSPQPITLSDLNTGVLIDFNPKMCEITGYTEDELRGKSSIELNLLGEKEREELARTIREKKVINNMELSIRKKNGGWVHTLITTGQVLINTKETIIAVLSDITELKKSQAEVKKLSIAIEQSANSIIITNPKGNIEYANQRLFELTGYQPSEIIGKKPSIFKSGHHDEYFYRELWNNVSKGETWKGEILNRKKNGSLYWEKAIISPITDERGKVIHILAIKEDVTFAKEQQEALVRSEQELRKLNATKDLFFSIIGHDLMNPFNALMGFNDLIKDAIMLHDEQKALEYATVIGDSSKRIFVLLQNLLLWSKAQSGRMIFQPSDVTIGELINSAILLQKESLDRKKIDLQVRIPEHETIFVDQNMIATVIRNLLVNAIKFSDLGGTISMEVNKTDKGYLFQVSDKGVGMSPKIMAALFQLEKIQSSKGTQGEIGTGLGLVICKEFISVHKGEIWVDSKEGEGSTFYFNLPKTW